MSLLYWQWEYYLASVMLLGTAFQSPLQIVISIYSNFSQLYLAKNYTLRVLIFKYLDNNLRIVFAKLTISSLGDNPGQFLPPMSCSTDAHNHIAMSTHNSAINWHLRYYDSHLPVPPPAAFRQIDKAANPLDAGP